LPQTAASRILAQIDPAPVPQPEGSIRASFSRGESKMFFLRKRPRRAGSFPRRRWVTLFGCGLVSTALSAGFGSALLAQSTGEKAPAQSPAQSSAQPQVGESVDEQLKALQRERDDLKRRNADLELRLKQLQATVDSLVHQALGEQPAAPPAPLPPAAGLFPRQALGPVITRFRPMFPPFPGIVDPVELATAFSDALGEKEAARPALDAAQQKASAGNGGTKVDVDAASARLHKASRKVQLLRNILTTARQVAADEAERMRRLGAVHAVSVAEVRNADARLKIFDEILAADPDAVKTPADATTPTGTTIAK
jgi:cell division septum initiation protein DivIVA